jgi:hypothetical protein
MRASTGAAAGHGCLANLVQGTVCKILGQEEIKPHKVRYHLERRDAELEQKMTEVLCVYREVQVLKKAASKINLAMLIVGRDPSSSKRILDQPADGFWSTGRGASVPRQ